jgi:nucleoside-diphosphate-sugar epimerase
LINPDQGCFGQNVLARFAFDLGRARLELGYSPRFEMAESVGRTVSWLRENGLV